MGCIYSFKSSIFFFNILVVGNVTEINKVISSFNQDIDKLIQSVIELVYFMRGSVSYEEMMRRTPGERQRIADFISDRLKIEHKKMHPVY
jgi:hypothetical protein